MAWPSWRVSGIAGSFDAVAVMAAALDDARGSVRSRRQGLRLFLLVISAITLPWERAEGKVQSWHQDRLAAVYLLSELRREFPSSGADSDACGYGRCSWPDETSRGIWRPWSSRKPGG